MSARAVWAVAAACASAFALTGGAAANVIVGVTDNGPAEHVSALWFYPAMATDGLAVDTISVRWDETAPNIIPSQTAIAAAITEASLTGVSVELDLYPLHSQALTDGNACAPSTSPTSCGDTAQINAFASWTARVAAAFPTVHQFVVMNECNQPLFINPQFDTSGANQSAEVCGRALVAAYDALSAESSANFVWGLGLSPRGNDNPGAASDASTSPVAFLNDLGDWFASYAKKTGRAAPLMDGLDFHPYPIPQSLDFDDGYTDTDNATVSNLPRIYQAFYDGFSGTSQKTIGQQPGGGLKVSLNEVGIQTSTAGHSGYTGTETSANTTNGVIAPYNTESYQASWYLQMLNLVACDPNVQQVNVFHLIDESDLEGWQSGLYYVDQTAKQSAGTVAHWIQTTHGACQGTSTPWTPAKGTTTTTTGTTTTGTTTTTGGGGTTTTSSKSGSGGTKTSSTKKKKTATALVSKAALNAIVARWKPSKGSGGSLAALEQELLARTVTQLATLGV